MFLRCFRYGFCYRRVGLISMSLQQHDRECGRLTIIVPVVPFLGRTSSYR
jgi:hypothetical protein